MRVFLKAHDLISSRTLSSSHTEILRVIPGSAHLEEDRKIKTDLEGCQHDGGWVYNAPTWMLLGEQVSSICLLCIAFPREV